MDELLSIEQLEWLKDHDYGKADHETRMALIKQVKELKEQGEID